MICKGCQKEYEPRHEKDYRCTECYSKIGKRSKRKGAANESRFAKLLNAGFVRYGVNGKAKATPRSGGISEFEQADIMFSHLEPTSIFKRIHFENKDAKNWKIEEWFDKAVEQEKESGKNREPCLIIRKPNKAKEYAVVNADFLVDLLMRLEIINAQETMPTVELEEAMGDEVLGEEVLEEEETVEVPEEEPTPEE